MKMLISGLVIALMTILSGSASAQQKPTDLDKSPMDVSYCPPQYPILKMSGKYIAPPVARVLYSRPQRNGRVIFGGIVQYGELWRVGANEATELEFFRNVKVGTRLIPKGRYTLYAIAGETSWTFVLNTDLDVWGMAHNARKDIASVKVPVQKLADTADALTIYFDMPVGGSTRLNVLWENCQASLPITLL